jgi:hypothetical protein
MLKTKLSRTKDTAPVHSFSLRIPLALYERMVKEGGLTWGDVTPFILSAIREKLDRQKKEGKT